VSSWLSRLVLALSVLLMPLAALSMAYSSQDVAACAPSQSEPASMSAVEDDGADAPGSAASTLDDNDDDTDMADSAILTGEIPLLLEQPASAPVRFIRRADARGPAVHLDVPTPPPRA
jgi:hypothetical protein